MNETKSRSALVLAILALVAGCTQSAATKSGVEPEPTTLVLANAWEGLTGAPYVAHFVERLEELSEGGVTVRVESTWKGGADEVRLLRDVAGGEADLGWAGVRALDQVGVPSLTPVLAPFLVDSYNAQRAVLADPDVQHGLHDLASAGLEGLALMADELRVPVGVKGPLLSPEDYEGAQIRTAPSDIQREGLEALGAKPTSAALQPTMDGAETIWWTYRGDYPHIAPFPTINTPLWPSSGVLVANPASLDGLSSEVRDWIDTAAQDAAAWSLAHARDREADEIAEACRGGARIATATPAQVEALTARVQPVYERLATNPATAEMFSRVQRLAAGATADAPAQIPADCAFQPGDEARAPEVPTRLTAPGDPGDLPQGVYRYELTPEYLRAAGLPEGDVRGNAGILTYTLKDGRWSFQQKPRYDNVDKTTCEGYYDIDGPTFTGSVVTTYASGECAPLLWTATWAFQGDTLTWTDISTDMATVFAGEHGWRKIA